MNNKLAPFICHGIDFIGKAGNQSIGNCPLCDKEGHLYVNRESGQWDCKSCGEAGNIYTFLKKYARTIHKETSVKAYAGLAKDRGLPIAALKGWNLGWNGEEWLLPVESEKGTCVDIRRWKKGRKGVYSTEGCKTNLYGLKRLAEAPLNGTIWLCEGEWDTIAMSWLLHQAGNEKDIAVGVPGAGTFKDFWVSKFVGRKVVLCYDNDEAGKKGTKRAYDKLRKNAKEVYIFRWTAGMKKGYDIRDFVIDVNKENLGPKEVMKKVWKNYVVEASEVRDLEDQEEKIEIDLEAEFVSEKFAPGFDETIKGMQRWIYMTPEHIDALKVMYAVVFSNRLAGDPLWVHIVGQASVGKTLLLNSMETHPYCVYRSSLTAQSLVSGWNAGGRDPSLLPQLNGKVLIWKDFTEVLAKPIFEREIIYTTLRGAYDGKVNRGFGNDVVRDYPNLHFSMLSGVTQAIEKRSDAQLGERFLKFYLRISEDEEHKVLNWIREKEAEVEERNRQIKDLSNRFLSRKIDVKKEKVRIPGWVSERIRALAELTAWLRAGIETAPYDERRMLYEADREALMRIDGQFTKLAWGLAWVDKKREVGWEQYRLVEKCALSSCNQLGLKIILALRELKGVGSIQEISMKSGVNYTTTRFSALLLSDLRILEKVEKGSTFGRKILQEVLSRRRRKKSKESERASILYKFSERTERILRACKLGLKPCIPIVADDLESKIGKIRIRKDEKKQDLVNRGGGGS